MAKKMLIDATHLEETRVVVVDGNKVDDFDFESVAKRQLSGNIYLAKVTRVEPSLQAAFVDYGGNRHGFLAFAEIHPDYYQIPVADREALIAEEAAEQERSEASEAKRDAGGDDKGKEKGKPRRGRRKKAAKPDDDRGAGEVAEARSDDASEPADASGAEDAGKEEAPKGRRSRRGRKADKHKSSGLEVIDFDAESSGPEGEPGTDEVRGLEIADMPEGEDDGSGPESDQGSPPKSMAEKTGLDEAETVSGDVSTDDEADKGKAAGKRGSGKGRRRGRQARQETAEPETTESHADDTIESIEPDEPQEEIARARAQLRRRYRIQDVIKVRQIMLVQVVKEERGNKGAALTTYLSLPGRYCVLMPNTARGGGISRKITNAADRKRLRQVVDELDVTPGMGLIVRTAGAERTKAEIKRDFEFLLRQWEQIRELTLKSIAPTLIYEEGSLIKRSIRDLYSKDIDAILVEGEAGYREAKDYMKMLMPSHARHVQQYSDRIPLYIRYQVESYLSGMFNPVVQLRSGGYIVIGQTEALVAIDVNSGRSTRESSVEETALKTNLEAAEEIARQLRLRDLAGLIVIDFIDMDEGRNNRAVEKRLKDKLKVDRARLQIGRISPFGLLEMSRQRLRPGMVEVSTQACPHCHGQGVIRSDESLALGILREIEEEGVRGRSAEVTLTAPLGIANYIMNAKRRHLAQVEERYGLVVNVEADPQLLSPDYHIESSKARSRAPAGAEQVVTAESAVAATAVETPEAEASPPSDDRGKGEGRSRRRRGRRGGRRRRGEDRRDDSGRGHEAQSEAPSEALETEVPAEDGTPAEPSTEASVATGASEEDHPSGDRSSRRRHGGRGRSRRNGDKGADTTVSGESTGQDAVETAGSGSAAATPDASPADEAPAKTSAGTAAAAAAPEETAAGLADEGADRGPDAEEAPSGHAETVSKTPAEADAGPKGPAGSRPKRRGWWQWR